MFPAKCLGHCSITDTYKEVRMQGKRKGLICMHSKVMEEDLRATVIVMGFGLKGFLPTGAEGAIS